MSEPSEIVADIVRSAVRRDPRSVDLVPTVEDSLVYRVLVGDDVLYLKSEHEGHPVAVLAWAYTEAAKAGVPVPAVVQLDTSCSVWPREFVLVSGVPGTDLEHLEPHRLHRAVEALGDVLRRLHTIELDGFGDLAAPDDLDHPPRGMHADHPSAVRAHARWGLPYLVDVGLLPERAAARLRSLLGRHDELVPGPRRGVLLHGDPRLAHAFVDEDATRVTGLIDLEPRSGDPLWDLADFAYLHPDLADALFTGYGVRGEDVRVELEFYGLLQAIGNARWEHEQGFDVGRHLGELERRRSALEALLPA